MRKELREPAMSTHILVVDASDEERSEASLALAAAGFSVIEATDGDEALQKLETSGRVDLIVCDADGPRSGVEFFQELGATEQPPPVIMMTAEGHPELMRHARECGARGCMVKPLKPAILVAAARKITTT
jgi:two-component system, chemotaxis family, chemotaxis protein CheY